MADLSVTADLNAQQIYNELRTLVSHLKAFSGTAKQSGDEASRGFVDKFKSGFLNIGANLIGGLAALGLGSKIKDTAEYGSKIQDLSDRFGVAAETLQQFGNAAALNGVSLEATAKAFKFLEVNQAKALGGSTAMQKAFQDLGISMTDLRTLKPEELMLKIGASSGNAADLVRILGKSALDLRPTLEGLADGTIQFGSAISAIDIANLDKLDDTLTQISISTRAFAGGLIGEGVKNFQVSIQELVLNATGSLEVLKGVFGAIGTIAQGQFNALAEGFGGVGKAIKLALQGQFGEAGGAIKEGVTKATEAGKQGLVDAGNEITAATLKGSSFFTEAEKVKDEAGKVAPPKRHTPGDESKVGKFDDLGNPIADKDADKLERDKDKLADEQRKNRLESLSPTARLAELKNEAADALAQSNDWTKSEQERVDLNLKHLAILKEIKQLEKEIAAAGGQKAADKLDAAKDKLAALSAAGGIVPGGTKGGSGAGRASGTGGGGTASAGITEPEPEIDLGLALAIQQAEARRLAASKPIPGGRVAGIGESQEKVNEIERNRLANEADQKALAGQPLAGPKRDHAEFAKEQSDKAKAARDQAREGVRSGELEGQRERDLAKTNLDQRNKDHAAELGRAMVNQEVEQSLNAPKMEEWLEKIAGNTEDMSANK